MKTLFVTGTDTGVGKTTIAVAIVAAWARGGRRIAVQKPIETGCPLMADGSLASVDGAALLAATGRALDPALVAPERYATPAAPEHAALLDRRPPPSLDAIARAQRTLAADCDALVVEGAGGLLVPVDARHTMADLAAAAGAALLVVARASLGTLNHTLLTIEAARARGLRVAGVVLNRTLATTGPEEHLVPETLERWGGIRVLGVFPHLPPSSVTTDALVDAAMQHIDLAALWEAL